MRKWRFGSYFAVPMKHSLDPSKTALILVDVQNDFYHADGALKRSGFSLDVGRSFIESLIKLSNCAREEGVLLVGSTFTLIADTQNDALVPLFISDLVVKLLRGDFQVSKWGHQIIEEVRPVHYVVDKTGPSAFFRTELDIILRHRNIENILIAGLNGTRSAIATAYDAMSLGVKPTIVSDCTTDFDLEGYNKLIESIGGVFDVRTCNEVLGSLKNG